MSHSTRDKSVSRSAPDPAKPVGNVTLVQDFLPIPEVLVLKTKSAKRQKNTMQEEE